MEKHCQKCKGIMNQTFATISGNAKYLTWECVDCHHKELKCTGVLK